MPFECKKYHGKCKAECCGLAPIPRPIWAKFQHLIQRPVKEKMLIDGKDGTQAYLPLTEDAYCCFLKDDLSCAIYEDRPPWCKKYGDESCKEMTCPMQDKEGNQK